MLSERSWKRESAVKNKFNGISTNENRARAGSKSGKEGRNYPIMVAERLNDDPAFLKKVCHRLRQQPCAFSKAIAGTEVGGKVESIVDDGAKTPTKTNLRMIWKDGRTTNFRVKCSRTAQIHLEVTANFIKGFEAQYKKSIPARVKEALLLFTGRHPNQKQILDSIPIDYVGDKKRSLERKYNNRLTLASMHGYDDGIVSALLEWLRDNASDLFLYCFSIGEAKDRSAAPQYLWYHDTEKIDSRFEIYSIPALAKLLSRMPCEQLAESVTPGDEERIGSTINLPFGNLQYHLHALQFRHQCEKIQKIYNTRFSVAGRKTFGSKQKKSGHENELLIAEELNKNKRFRTHFCERVGFKESDFVVAQADGIHAKMEESVICGKKTAGKTDIVVMWKGGYITNISIKKNSAGQVYLVTANNFVAAYEAQYNVIVPEDVKRALALFIGEAEDSKDILDSTDLSVDGNEARRLAYEQNSRLMFDVIKNYDPQMADDLLAWMRKQIVTVFELCFSAGAVKDKTSWAHLLWYKNLVDVDGQGLDYMVPIKRVMAALKKKEDENIVCRGPKNAGSTIQLPFGHLQYHLKQLEFYQKLAKIQKVLEGT